MTGPAGTAARSGLGPQRRTYPGDLAEVREVRRWVTGLLPWCPGRDDLVTVASELAANAVQHTGSGRDGWFGVEITWPPGCVRVTVDDQGALTGPRLVTAPTAECGRGLRIVQALSARVGVTGGTGGRAVWAEIPWASPPRDRRPRTSEGGPRHGAVAGPGRGRVPVAPGSHALHPGPANQPGPL